MEKEILEILKTINGRFDGLEGRFDRLEGRFDDIEKKVDKLEEGQEKIVDRLDNLESGQKQIKDKLDDMSEDITRELSNIASKVSGVDEITIKNAHHIIDLDMELIKLKSMH